MTERPRAHRAVTALEAVSISPGSWSDSSGPSMVRAVPLWPTRCPPAGRGHATGFGGTRAKASEGAEEVSGPCFVDWTAGIISCWILGTMLGESKAGWPDGIQRHLGETMIGGEVCDVTWAHTGLCCVSPPVSQVSFLLHLSLGWAHYQSSRLQAWMSLEMPNDEPLLHCNGFLAAVIDLTCTKGCQAKNSM